MIQDEEGTVFSEVPFEGICGLAFQSMSARKVLPIFDSIAKQKALEHNEFAFYLSQSDKAGNAIFWGGVDPAFYDGRLQYFPVMQEHYWALRLLQFRIGDEVIFGAHNVSAVLAGGDSTYALEEGDHEQAPASPVGAPYAIVDTGTTYFTAHGRIHHAVMSRLNDARCNNITDHSHPPITYVLQAANGKAVPFIFRNAEYMVGHDDEVHGGGVCRPAFMHVGVPKDHGPGMVLGEIFLRHYFAVFKRDVKMGSRRGAAVALARSRHNPGVHERLKELTASQPRFRPRSGS